MLYEKGYFEIDVSVVAVADDLMCIRQLCEVRKFLAYR